MDTKLTIIKEALLIFSENGLNFSMDSLAAKLKMSKRTVYELVESKENLICLCEDYLKQLFDDHYTEVLSNENICFLDKFDLIINYFDEQWFISRTHREQITKTSEVIDKKITAVRQECLGKAFSLLEQHYDNQYTLAYDKDVFIFIYENVLIELTEQVKQDPTVDFKKQQYLIVNNLIHGIISSNSQYFGGILLQRLLSRSKMGLILFRYDGEIKPIYLSPGYRELFDNAKDDPNFLNTIITEQGNENSLNVSFSERKEVKFDYSITKNDKQIYFTFKALPINWQLYNDVYLAIVTDVTETKNRELALEISEKKFKLALKQTSVDIWEFNIANKTLILSDTLKELYNLNSSTIVNVEDFFAMYKVVHPDYIKKFTKFYHGIIAGQKSGECKLKMIDKFGNFRLFKLSYKMIFDNNNTPVTAVGVVAIVNTNIGVQSKFSQEEQLIKLLGNEIECGIQYNVSEDAIEQIFGKNKFNLDNASFEEFSKAIIATIASDADLNECQNILTKKGLYNLIESNRNYYSVYYRAIKQDGSIVWNNLIARFISDPFTGDDHLFMYIIESDKVHKLELGLPEKTEYDFISKVFVQSTLKHLTNFAISNETDITNDCAFVILDFINLPTIKMRYGLDVAEKLLVHFSRVLHVCFSNHNIVGRVDDNQFAVFFPNVDNLYDLRVRIEEVVAMAHNSYVLSTNEEKIAKIYFSIFASSLENANYNYLYDKCNNQLNVLKLHEDEIIDSIDNIDSYVNYTSYDYDSNIDALYDDEAKQLNELVTNLYSEISTYKDANDIINQTLRVINNYYSAYRTSVFVLSNDKLSVTLCNEYTMGEIVSFDDVHFNIDEIPGFSYIADRKEPIVIKTNYSQDEIVANYYKNLRKSNINLFYAMPLVEKNETIGFLTVSNATDHLGELTLLRTLSQTVGNEITKNALVENQKLIDEVDKISKLYNYNYYRKTISRYKNIVLSSLGVAFIKINDIRMLNSEHGNDYVDNIILKIADTLRERFRVDSIFRVDSDTFALIVPDIDYDAFTNRFNWTVNKINKIKFGIVSAGQTWSDTDIDIEKLLNHSEELMRINENTHYYNEEYNALEQDYKLLIDAINRNWFTFFLQPKVDLNTNKVVSAESLVRLIHPTYGLISPAKIIPILEKNKMVSVVDFYVLELVCKRLKKWQKKGRELIPISVNYSRITLLEKDVVERTINIINKYGIDKSLIEIEITETIGNMEHKFVAELAEMFMQNGIRLALDDFGSEYSSLSTLALVPFNVVKLDKSIINDIVTNKRSQVIVENVMSVCKKLDMITVAEGIETESQWKEVKRMGCDLGQGYFFGKPIKIKEFEEKFLKLE